MKETDRYQKAVKIENPCAVTMTPIEAAAQTDCPTLNRSPLTVPGPPINSFIFSPSEGPLYFFFPSTAKQGPGISAMKTKRALPLAMSSNNRLPSLESLLRTHHQLDWASGEAWVEDLRRSSDWDSAATISSPHITSEKNHNPTKSLAEKSTLRNL